MSIIVSYPVAAGDGAVDDSGALVSACGEWLRPDAWGVTDRCRVYAKVYPETGAVDVGVPGDAVEGNILPNDMASGGEFNFNTSILPNALAGTTMRIKVWLKNIDTGNWQADGPITFVGCVDGAEGCDAPPCNQ